MLTTVAITILTAVFLILGSGYFAVYLIANFQSFKTARGFLINVVSLIAFALVILVLFGVVKVAGL